jgi:hypothetical protein
MASYRAGQTAGRKQSARRNKIEQQNEKLAEREYLFRKKPGQDQERKRAAKKRK